MSTTVSQSPMRLAALVAMGLSLWSTMVLAQDLPPAVAAIVDYQRILRDAVAARSIRDQIEARRQDYQEEISSQEQRLRDADKELAKQRSLLSADAFAEKRRQFETDVADVQRFVQDRRRQLDEASAAALNDVRRVLIEIVGGLADQHGFNLVLSSASVLVYSPDIDLTEQVLEQLDSKLPSVTVPEPTE